MPGWKQRGNAKESFVSSAEACFTIEIGFESSAGRMLYAGEKISPCLSFRAL